MILMIDPPVNWFSSIDAIRDWIVELAGMREHHRNDQQALWCITQEEHYARDLLEEAPARLAELQRAFDAAQARGVSR